MIVEAMDRLQTTGKDALNSFEESKEIDAEKINRGQMVDWCGLGVHILTENLEDHEKIKVLSRVQDDIRNRGKAPQEIEKKESFRDYMDSLCRHLTTDVESVRNEIEVNRIIFEKMLESQTEVYERDLKALVAED